MYSYFVKGLPPSKSFVNRLFTMAFLTGNFDKVLHQIYRFWQEKSLPEDVQLMLKAFSSYYKSTNQEALVIDVGGGGTVLRFLLSAFSLLTDRRVEFVAESRLRERPIQELLDTLNYLGADITAIFTEDGKWSHLQINPRKKNLKGAVIDASLGNKSSQFISSLLLVAPYLSTPLEIRRDKSLPSVSYIDLTLSMMKMAGASIEDFGEKIIVKNTPYTSSSIERMAMNIEGDWSAASYLYSWVLTSSQNVQIHIPYLKEEDGQGDKRIALIMKELGVQTEFLDGSGIKIWKENSSSVQSVFSPDLKDVPDLLPALFVSCILNNIPFHFRNVAHLRLKESDRLSELVAVANQMGYFVKEDLDAVFWEGDRELKDEKELIISTKKDHRLAMSWSIAYLLDWKLQFDDFSVIRKSYPLYGEDFSSYLHLVGKEGMS